MYIKLLHLINIKLLLLLLLNYFLKEQLFKKNLY